jgi:hypothetical protein
MDLTVCCIKGCDRASVALGLCSLHYRRTRLYGSPAATKWHSGTARHVSIEERFMERVRKTDSCWTWIGGRDAYGYPMFRANIGGVLFKKGHRASFALFRGPVAEGMHVCHACDNPSCVNPDHLFLGTNKDNMRDKIAKGRAQAPKGEDSPHATLTEEQAQTILLDARPYIVIAAEYGVAASTVGSIKNRVSWRHLSGEPAKAKRIGQRGTACYRATLTDEAVRAIRASSERGKDLAVKFGVSPQTITDIRKQRSWTHVN